MAAAEKYMPQLQHNMRVVDSKAGVLSVITAGGNLQSYYDLKMARRNLKPEEAKRIKARRAA